MQSCEPTIHWRSSVVVHDRGAPAHSRAVRRVGCRPLLTISIALALTGCQPSERKIEASVRYEPPAEYHLESSTVFDAEFDEIWEQLLRRASESPFRVLAAQKQSQFLVVGFSGSDGASPASEFVDCGRLERTLTEAGRSERFAYALVESSRDREVDLVEDHYRIREVERDTHLEARTTLFLKPISKQEHSSQTQVTANTRYTLTVLSSGASRNIPRSGRAETAPSKRFGPDRVEVAFTSMSEGTFPEGATGHCRATGEVERTLLALAAPAAPDA